MFTHGSQTPSRRELLSMVKKHSNLLGKTVVDEQDASDIEMDQGFWHDVLNLYFIQGKESRGRQDDDLVFFVRKHGTNSKDDSNGNLPYFVRRWASELDSMVGDNLLEVDWRRSFYLNLIAHTSFTVTVAICSNQVLRNHRAGQGTPLNPIYKVLKTVYASPSRVNFHLDARKEAETVPAYPDICFAIDDFDSTIDTVLSDTDHCYCVVLDAHDGAAFPTVNLMLNDAQKTENDLGKTNKVKVTIFSGFVSYQMVREAFDADKYRLGSLLSFSHSSSKADRLYMKGPGGRGEVEVAVSGVEDQSRHVLEPSSPIVSKSGFGLATIVKKASSFASVAKKVYEAASRNADDEMLPLKCCLMSISLPWEHIAHDMLFKEGPPVNM
ncbi:hypothetical protein RND81_03G038800 [Saponaria officinalis]|uniref:Cw7 protein n=1 Tax=Saponaria officinalis TaxID=3572 RepID=A0AAW1M3P3_SAPOF